MKPNWYFLITEAIEIGLERGWRVAHKHTDDPDRELIAMSMYSEIINRLTEIIIFEEEVKDSE